MAKFSYASDILVDSDTIQILQISLEALTIFDHKAKREKRIKYKMSKAYKIVAICFGPYHWK